MFYTVWFTGGDGLVVHEWDAQRGICTPALTTARYLSTHTQIR